MTQTQVQQLQHNLPVVAEDDRRIPELIANYNRLVSRVRWAKGFDRKSPEHYVVANEANDFFRYMKEEWYEKFPRDPKDAQALAVLFKDMFQNAKRKINDDEHDLRCIIGFPTHLVPLICVRFLLQYHQMSVEIKDMPHFMDIVNTYREILLY